MSPSPPEREQGRRAAEAGIAHDQNPYRPGTRGHAAWDAGWYEEVALAVGGVLWRLWLRVRGRV